MVGASLAATAATGALLLLVALWVTRVEDWRTYAPAGGYGGRTGDAREHAEKPAGITRWLTTVDHKDIGVLYGAFAVLAFAWGGVAVLLMRIELAGPGVDIIKPATYNQLMTSHGITMLFLFGTPVLAAFGNYFVPLLVGADDMAFPRINAIAFWL
ncbi:MAG: cbb3-type cytochrome c oxidase subunit I, partial [Halobacteriaceae archaeon]